MSYSHNCLIIVLCLWADTHNHPHFPLPIEVVLEEVSQLGVSIGDNLLRVEGEESGAGETGKAGLTTLLASLSWLSRSVSIQVRSTIRDWLMLPGVMRGGGGGGRGGGGNED